MNIENFNYWNDIYDTGALFFSYTRVRAFYLIRFRLVSLSFAPLRPCSRGDFKCDVQFQPRAHTMPPPILFVHGLLVFRGYTNDSLCAETSRRSLLSGILHVSLLNYILNAPIERNSILFSFILQYLVKANRLRNNSIPCKYDKIKIYKCLTRSLY